MLHLAKNVRNYIQQLSGYQEYETVPLSGRHSRNPNVNSRNPVTGKLNQTMLVNGHKHTRHLQRAHHPMQPLLHGITAGQCYQDGRYN